MRLELKGIQKAFSDKKVLHAISFTVESGRAMGFLGRNGAGKTTTIRILMDIFKADQGSILLDGKSFDRKQLKIGYLPEERGMYQKVTVLNQLIYFGVLKGMSRKQARYSSLHYLERLQLSEFANKKLEILSKGNQQKVQIIQALIDHPDIVILDEPFSGLDPVNAMVLKDLIRELIQKDKLVIFSSHQMSYVEEFCDDISLIKQGRIVCSGQLNQIKKEMGRHKYLIQSEVELDLSSIEELVDVENIEKHPKGYLVHTKRDNFSELLSVCAQQQLDILSIGQYQPSLEEIFIQLDQEVSNETSL